jgi:hypothetical protein
MVSTTGQTCEAPCPYCMGHGWKYFTLRSTLQALALSGGEPRTRSRRACLDCGGFGSQRVAAS